MGDQRAGAVFLCGSHKEDKGNCGEREKCKQRNKASILEWQTHKLIMMDVRVLNARELFDCGRKIQHEKANWKKRC